MDWLYQELEPGQQVAFDEHLARCGTCAEEASRLQATRQAFGGLALEEPPPQVSAIVLFEASKRGAQTPASAGAQDDRLGEEEGLLARLLAWLRPLAVHPAVTACASIAVIAGVAGVLWVRGGGSEMAKPSAVTSASSEASPSVPGSALGLAPDPGDPAAAPPAPPPSEPLDEDVGLGNANGALIERYSQDDGQGFGSGAGAARAKRDGYAVDLLDEDKAAELDAKVEAARGDRVTGGAQGKAKAAASAPELSDRESKRRREQTTKRTLRATTRPSKNEASGGLVADDAAEGAAESEQAPAFAEPPPESATAAPKQQPAAPGAKGEASGRGGGAQAPLADQRQRTLTLAKAGRCVDAARLANDVRDRDRGYYDRNLAKEPALEPCLGQVASEQRRRASRKATADEAN